MERKWCWLVIVTSALFAACESEPDSAELSFQDPDAVEAVAADVDGKVDALSVSRWSGLRIGGRCLGTQGTWSGSRVAGATCAGGKDQLWLLSGGKLMNGSGLCATTAQAARAGVGVVLGGCSLAPLATHQNGAALRIANLCVQAADGPAALTTCSTTSQVVDARPRIDIRIQAVKVTDTGGGRAPTFTGADVLAFIQSHLNPIYAPAFVRFVFDPATDVATVADTILNTVSAGTATATQAGWANSVGARWPGKMVVFLRHGGYATPDGGSYSSGIANHVMFRNFPADAGFLLAHETGHYIGLDHTFPGSGGATLATMTTWAQNNTLWMLDGDGLSDTPWDPGVDAWAGMGWPNCGPNDLIVIPGTGTSYVVKPDRKNVMGYFFCEPGHVSPQQIEKVRSNLASALRRYLTQAFTASAPQELVHWIGKCVTAPTLFGPGARVTVSTCTNTTPQKWQFTTAKELRTGSSCITAAASGFAELHPCDGRASQKFTRWMSGLVQDAASGKCFATTNNNAADGEQLASVACSTASFNARWWSYAPGVVRDASAPTNN